MTLQELIFYCATTNNGKRDFEKCYEKGRADAIEEFITLAKNGLSLEDIERQLKEQNK